MEKDKFITRRVRLISWLSFLVLFFYGAFAVGMAFFPGFMAIKVSPNSFWNLGFILIGLIAVTTIGSSWFYLSWMDRNYTNKPK